MEKFREFYINLNWENNRLGAPISDTKFRVSDVHVIEKAAFDELMGIAEEMQYALKEGDQFNKHKALSDFEDFKQKLGGGE